MKLLVVLGSEREGRAGAKVADWFLPIAREKADVDFADLKEVNLPLEMEAVSPSQRQDGNYPRPEDKAWGERVKTADAVVFVMPEYNHGYSATIKNAIDHIYHEWNGKPVGFVGYGVSGAVHAIENIAPVLGRIQANVITEPRVGINEIWAAFDESGQLKDGDEHKRNAIDMLEALETKVATK